MRAFKKRQFFVALVGISLLSLVFLGFGCDGGGGGGGAVVVDPCAGGPVPCLTEDWGDTYYAFEDQGGYPVAVVSDGTATGVGAYVLYEGTDLYLIGVGGPVIDCYNAELEVAIVDFDWPPDGVPEYETWDVEGRLDICNETLTISGLIIDGYAYDDIVATYVESGVLSADIVIQEERELEREIMNELMKRLSVE